MIYRYLCSKHPWYMIVSIFSIKMCANWFLMFIHKIEKKKEILTLFLFSVCWYFFFYHNFVVKCINHLKYCINDYKITFNGKWIILICSLYHTWKRIGLAILFKMGMYKLKDNYIFESINDIYEPCSTVVPFEIILTGIRLE